MVEPEKIAHAFLEKTLNELDESFRKVRHCFAQLSDDDVWWGPEAHINSIGTILLHVNGNLRQWVLSGIGGAPDVRDRPAEFTQHRTRTKAELLEDLDALVREVREVLQGVLAGDILAPRRIQGFDETVLSAIYDTVTHFKGHVYQIMLITRLRTGDRYKLSWAPENKEQGA